MQSDNKISRKRMLSRKHYEASIDNGIRYILQDEDGKRFLWWIFEITDILGSSFRGEETHLTAFALGQENVGKQILARLETTAPDAWLKLREENVETYDEEID